jgi:PhzF family phenazine biosynthesis protein
MPNNARQRYFVVDAFTDRPFAGNPAAVVPLPAWRPDDWLQNVALEMNLSETAFFVPTGDAFELRWFTPKLEVDLCGHATLAAAKIIAYLELVATSVEIVFASRSGRLVARLHDKQITLDFPSSPEQPASPPAGLIEAVGVPAVYVGRSKFDYLVEVESEAAVRGLTPDLPRLATVATRGVIVTARADDSRFDFVSRFFAPAAGVDEDPVTGSAHCCLAMFWQKRLGKTLFAAYQASARGGTLSVEIVGERVLLGGQAVIVAAGELWL